MWGMVGPRTQSIHVLTQGETASTFDLPIHFTSQLGKSKMSWIRFGLQGHVTTVGVKLPDQAWIFGESLWCCERLGGVVLPYPSGATESWKSRCCRQAGTDECQDVG